MRPITLVYLSKVIILIFLIKNISFASAKCDCNKFGSDSATPCDPKLNKCNCLKNVVGQKCDKCSKYYWNLKSGTGCIPCNCDVTGSKSKDCDLVTGQCKCRENFEGLTCKQCKRGYVLKQKQCTSCGECFDSWNLALSRYREKHLPKPILGNITNVENINQIDDLEKVLQAIEDKLSLYDSKDFSNIESQIETIKNKFQSISKLFKTTELDNVKSEYDMNKNNLLKIKEEMEIVKKEIELLESEKNNLQDSTIEGLLTLIEEAHNKANNAVEEALIYEHAIREAENKCDTSKKGVLLVKKEFQESQTVVEDNFAKAMKNIEAVKKLLPILSQSVCGLRNDNCQNPCGGIGCQTCGELLECQMGSKKKLFLADTFSKQVTEMLGRKENELNELFRNLFQINISELKLAVQEYVDEGNTLNEETKEILKQVESILRDKKDMLKKFDGFDILKTILKDILSRNITFSYDELQALMKEFEDIAKSISDNELSKEALDKLQQVKKFKEEAEYIKIKALEIQRKKQELEAINNMFIKIIDVVTNFHSKLDGYTNEISRIEKQLNEEYPPSNNKKLEADFDSKMKEFLDLENEISNINKFIDDFMSNEILDYLNRLDDMKEKQELFLSIYNENEEKTTELEVLLDKMSTLIEETNEVLPYEDIEKNIQRLLQEIDKHYKIIQKRKARNCIV